MNSALLWWPRPLRLTALRCFQGGSRVRRAHVSKPVRGLATRAAALVPHQAERGEGQSSLSWQEQSNGPDAQCSAIAAGRGLRRPRRGAPLRTSTSRYWTPAVSVARQERCTEPLETRHGVIASHSPGRGALAEPRREHDRSCPQGLDRQPPPACSKLQDTARYAQCTNLAPHFQAVFEIADSRLPPPEDLLRFDDGFEYAISWNGLCQRYSRQASRSRHDR